MTNTTLRPDCAKPTDDGPCRRYQGHFGHCRPLHNRNMALYSVSLIAQLEQAQWVMNTIVPLDRYSLTEQTWAEEFDTAVPMIYGGYIL